MQAAARPSGSATDRTGPAQTFATHALADRLVRVARDTDALAQLRPALNFLAITHLLAGELTTAAVMIEEDRLIAEATGVTPIAYAAMALVAWRGDEAQASQLIEATMHKATARGLGRMVNFATYASSVLYNGLGRHGAARDAAWRVFERDRWVSGPLSCPSWPRRLRGPATKRSSGPHSSGCPNARE